MRTGQGYSEGWLVVDTGSEDVGEMYSRHQRTAGSKVSSRKKPGCDPEKGSFHLEMCRPQNRVWDFILRSMGFYPQDKSKLLRDFKMGGEGGRS